MSHTRPYRMFNAALVRTEQVSPHLRRMTFGGPDVADMATWAPDQRIKIFFPSGDLVPAMPDTDDWYATYKAVPVSQRVPMRTYTIRALRADAAEVDIDFVLHGENGPASRWATHARAGDKVQISAPNRRAATVGGGYEWKPPEGMNHVLLAADETALPALAGILEELAQRAAPPRGEVFIEVPSATDRLDLPHWAGLTVSWLPREGKDADRRPGSLLVEAVRGARLPQGSSEMASVELAPVDIDQVVPWEQSNIAESDFYAWIAGESEAVMDIRRYLFKDKGLDRRTFNIMGYWRFGKVYE